MTKKSHTSEVKISLIENKIEVDVQQNKELLENEDYQVAFDLMGFTQSLEKKSYYIIADDTEKIIKEIIDYLKENKLKVSLDTEISNTLNNIHQREVNLEKARRVGLKIKLGKNVCERPKHFSKSVDIKSYQKISINHMVNVENTANFSMPGSGKTLMTYGVYDLLKSKKIVEQLFVVGPLASFRPWEDEYQFCFNANPKKNIIRHIGTNRDKDISRLRDYDVILTSIGTATNDSISLRNQLFKQKKIMMVIDESHRIKSFDEDATFANSMIELGRDATRRYILTGTPMPHDWEDLWSQITFLWPNNEILGTRDDFNSLLDDMDGERIISDRINFLWTRVSNRQMEKELPKKNRITHFVKMDPIQDEIYSAIESGIISNQQSDDVGFDKITQWRKNKVLRLLQSVTNPKLLTLKDPLFNLDPILIDNSDILQKIKKYDEIPAKIRSTAELARNISDKGKNVIIYTIFIKNVDYLCNLLHDKDPIPISSEISTKEKIKDVELKERHIDKFKNGEGKGRILVATLGSIAESVSLHKNDKGESICQDAIYLEKSFNAGQYMQSLQRINRLGSDKKKPINYHFMISRFNNNTGGTIDGIIEGVLSDRVRIMHNLLNDQYRLRPLSLNEYTFQINGKAQFYGENETFDDVMEKILEIIKKRKKNKK